MNTEELPISFLTMMQELLGSEYGAYLDSFNEERLYGLRINTSKITAQEFEAQSALGLSPVPWAANGYYYDGSNRPAKAPGYYAGLYYLQEPSAMAPASLLPITPGDRVLDLCAAPGGKSTELGVRLQGKGLLFANDISSSRAKGLLKNLELWGIPNICVTSEEPKKLAEYLPEYFDKILVDAPCSGEGMFRKDPDMIKSYREHGPEYYGNIQREIGSQAVRMLKPGGLLLYSTCTFSPHEDEETIKYLLAEHEDMKLVTLPAFEGASDGVGLLGCIRLFPHRIKGEGHFMALLQKRDEPGLVRPEEYKKTAAQKLPEDLVKFLSLIKKEFDTQRIIVKNQMVYYLPEGFRQGLNLRYLRTGLLLGEMKKDRFEPSQALAMTLTPETFISAVSWPKEDERVLRYLKGETLALTASEAISGWCLVCVDGHALGFAKGMGATLKNKYYPGWRWQ